MALSISFALGRSYLWQFLQDINGAELHLDFEVTLNSLGQDGGAVVFVDLDYGCTISWIHGPLA